MNESSEFDQGDGTSFVGEEQMSAVAMKQPGRDATVFVVDDEEVVRESLHWLIESIGLCVETFASAQEFLAAYDPNVCGCLVLDVRMPGISGLELQEMLHERGHALPIIIVTGYADVPMAVRAMKNGAMEFLRKPYSDQQLLDMVQQALQNDADARAKHAGIDELRQRFASLTPRESEVLSLVVLGKASRVIAKELDISQKTVETHRTHIMKKLKARNVAQLTHLHFEWKAAEDGDG